MSKPSFIAKPLVVRGLAELIIIIVGILVALWVDQWWADRVDARTQRSYLAALLEDITVTVEHLDELTQLFAGWRDAASELSYQPLKGSGLTNAQMIDLLGPALFEFQSFDNRLSAHQDLKSTGRLGLITNGDIRRSLAKVDQILEEISASEADLIATQHATIDPYLVRHMDLSAVAKAGYLTIDTSQMDRAGIATADTLIGEPVGIDHTGLLKDSQLRGILALRIILLSELMGDYSDLKFLLLDLREKIIPVIDR